MGTTILKTLYGRCNVNSSPKYLITIIDGPSPGKKIEISKPIAIIGRDAGADINIPSPMVSRWHARITHQEFGFLIEDLGSSNGTSVGGQVIQSPTPIFPGNEITLGQAIRLVFEVPVAVGFYGGGEIPANIDQTMMDAHVVTDHEGETIPELRVSVAGGEEKSYSLTSPMITIGRAPENDIVIPSQAISRRHATLERVAGSYQISVSPEATNPLLIDGRPVTSPVSLVHNQRMRVGGQDPGLMVSMVFLHPSASSAAQPARSISLGSKEKITFGRDVVNDVVLDEPNVSRFHAQIERVGQRFRLKDLRSANGTYVNNQQVDEEIWLNPNDTVRIASYRFVVGQDQLAQFDDSGGFRVEAVGLNKWVRKNLNILQNISLIFEPKEFVVVVGQSGGGKSTLVDALAGYRPATHGEVTVNGINIYKNFDAIRTNIGFVPQKDIIHMGLTVFEALDYSARLRMPADTSKSERHKRVLEVLDDLDLAHRKDVKITGLSGGQQKRVSIGVELLTKPDLFFLDEPTSGLDPGTETALMQLMRRLADQGRTIVLITHATKNVMMADKVIFLARGGYLAWFGPPDEALEYFDQFRTEQERRSNRMEFDQIYGILDDPNKGDAATWAQRFQEHPAYQNYIINQLASEQQVMATGIMQAPSTLDRIQTRIERRMSGIHQFMVLSSRNVRILIRDRSSLILMLLAAPLIGMLDVLLASSMGADLYDYNTGDMANVTTTLFLLTIYSLMVGGMSQMREFVKERDIYQRERLVNLKILPYVFSKVWIALVLAFYQATMYVAIRYLTFDMPGGTLEFGLIFGSLVLTTFAGMMMGLMVSSFAPNSNSAPLLIILMIIPQIVLSGAIAPVPPSISAVATTRWAFQAYMGITGVGSDVIADACWDLPEELRELDEHG